MSFKYNPLILLGRILMVTGMSAVFIILILFLMNGQAVDRPILLIFIFVIFSLFIFSFTRAILRETYNITINDEGLTLTRPVSGTTTIIDATEIRGYSKSNVKFGTNWGRSLFKSESIIIYSIYDAPFEIISFNYSGFEKIENELTKLGLEFFGGEKYETGLFTRKYKF